MHSSAQMRRHQEPTEKQKAVAKAVVRDGKSFRQASLDAGYALSRANRGPATSVAEMPGLREAFLREATAAEMDAKSLKAVVTHRLVTDVIRGRDSGVTRQAELLGRMKEVDMFVRNTDVQVGVFAALADDGKVATTVELLSTELPKDE